MEVHPHAIRVPAELVRRRVVVDHTVLRRCRCGGDWLDPDAVVHCEVSAMSDGGRFGEAEHGGVIKAAVVEAATEL